MKYEEGQEVTLLEFDNGDEVVPEQRAVVIDVPDGDGDPYLICVLQEDRDSQDRDGLTEVMPDQMRPRS